MGLLLALVVASGFLLTCYVVYVAIAAVQRTDIEEEGY